MGLRAATTDGSLDILALSGGGASGAPRGETSEFGLPGFEYVQMSGTSMSTPADL